MQAELPQELVKPISGIWLGKPVYASQWAGNGELNSFVPYLAGKGDLIAFDYSSKPITAQFAIEYLLGYNHNELVILPMLQSDDDLQSIFPLLAELMFHTNDIDLSDDNFREWLIANRPKAKIMELVENDINNELFKFLQLREHADNVKITQEMGQELFRKLFAHANAIAQEEVSGDALATDTSEFVLELVNNLINSAPKPTFFQKMDISEYYTKSAASMKTRGVYLLSDAEFSFADGDEDIEFDDFKRALVEMFGDMHESMTSESYWYVKINGVICGIHAEREPHCCFANVRFDRETKLQQRDVIKNILKQEFAKAWVRLNEESNK